MSAVYAALLALAAAVECGISTSPFGATADPETLGACNGGPM